MATDELQGLLVLLAAAEQALAESVRRGDESYVDQDTVDLIQRLRDRLEVVVRVRVAATNLLASAGAVDAVLDVEPDPTIPPTAPESSLEGLRFVDGIEAMVHWSRSRETSVALDQEFLARHSCSVRAPIQ